MTPEYEFRKDAIMTFSKNSTIIGPNFESRNLIFLTPFNVTGSRAISEGKEKKARFLNLIVKNENKQFLLTFRIY